MESDLKLKCVLTIVERKNIKYQIGQKRDFILHIADRVASSVALPPVAGFFARLAWNSCRNLTTRVT
jgi:hypothetical protein